jgi:hypothetical protein
MDYIYSECKRYVIGYVERGHVHYLPQPVAAACFFGDA